MVMLGSECSPCCASCPDFSFLLQADAVRAEIAYSFTDTNTIHGGYSSSFAGEYTIPRVGNTFPVLPIAIDGKNYSLEFIKSGAAPFELLFFRVIRLGTPDSWRAAVVANLAQPFGSVGICEKACGQIAPGAPASILGTIPVSIGTWGDTQFLAGNPGRPPGQFTYTFRRDNVTAFTGSNGSFPSIYRTNNNTNLSNLANWCEGTTSRAVYRQSITGDRFTKAEFSGTHPFYGTWSFEESVSVTKLEAVFSSFSQNILFDVEQPVWAINKFAMQTTGGNPNRSFTSYTTPCPTPFG